MSKTNHAIYLSVPFRRRKEADVVERRLVKLFEARGSRINVYNPCQLVDRGLPPAELTADDSRRCYDLIDLSFLVVAMVGQGTLSGDGRFGRDCSAEVGYGKGKQIPILAFTNDDPDKTWKNLTNSPDGRPMLAEAIFSAKIYGNLDELADTIVRLLSS